MPVIHSNDSWSRLREVWLGDVYPTHFYDHLVPEVRDVFYQITEWTREDLAVIERKLQEFGVVVRRPQYHSIENHMIFRDQLVKPDITPRDYYTVVNNALYVPHWRPMGPGDFRYPWQQVVDEYKTDPQSQVVYFDCPVHISGANMVRVGRDLYLDCYCPVHDKNETRTKREIFDQEVVPMFPDHRMHYVDNGGHMDGCFAILKPGYIIANSYFDDYENTFPGWEIIMLDKPEFWNHAGHYDPRFQNNGRWWLPEDIGNRAFNDHVIQYAQDWVGNYRETYFEVNCLVVDEKNVLMLGENEAVFNKLASIGITAHPMPFRCRTFWDGGIHCLTVDIRRDGPIVDLFPERG